MSHLSIRSRHVALQNLKYMKATLLTKDYALLPMQQWQ